MNFIHFIKFSQTENSSTNKIFDDQFNGIIKLTKSTKEITVCSRKYSIHSLNNNTKEIIKTTNALQYNKMSIIAIEIRKKNISKWKNYLYWKWK